MKILIILLSCLWCIESFAEKRIFWSRASDRDGFPTSAACYFSGQSPVNFQNDLLLIYNCYGEENTKSQLWKLSLKGEHQLILESQNGNLFSGLRALKDEFYLSEFNGGGTKTLWRFQQGLKKIALPSTVNMVQDLAVLGPQKLWLRYTDHFGVQAHAIVNQEQWDLLETNDVSYFFSAASNEKLMVQKVRLGESGEIAESRPDEIRIGLAPDYKMKAILKDKDADPTSEFLSFRNFSVVQDEYWTVIAKTQKGDVAVVGKNLDFKILPLYEEFESIDFWPPAITPQGGLVIRGKSNGVNGLWLINSKTHLILRSGDTVMTDKGLARLTESLFYNHPVARGSSILIGVGVEHFDTDTFLGQALIEVSTSWVPSF